MFRKTKKPRFTVTVEPHYDFDHEQDGWSWWVYDRKASHQDRGRAATEEEAQDAAIACVTRIEAKEEDRRINTTVVKIG